MARTESSPGRRLTISEQPDPGFIHVNKIVFADEERVASDKALNQGCLLGGQTVESLQAESCFR